MYRERARIAWAMWTASLILILLSAALFSLNQDDVNPNSFIQWLPNLVGLLYASVGLLIASHRPDHVIGWLYCVEGLGWGLVTSSEQYANFSIVTHSGMLPAGDYLAWATSTIQASLWIGLLTFMLMLFPTGYPVSRRWWPLIWFTVALIILVMLASAIRPGPLDAPFAFVTNPIGVSHPRLLVDAIGQILGGAVGGLLLLAAQLGSVVSLLVRLHQSRGIERLQIKWFVYVATVALAASLVSGNLASLWPSARAMSDLIINLVFVPGLPVVVALAILRYRLYDIDRIINKTLVYSALTVHPRWRRHPARRRARAPARAGRLGLQPDRGRFDAGGRGPDPPVRARIQTTVDRRFYRHKYDAARTLEAFSLRLRDQTDLTALATELGSVVHDTMQPTHVSLWLREHRS